MVATRNHTLHFRIPELDNYSVFLFRNCAATFFFFFWSLSFILMVFFHISSFGLNILGKLPKQHSCRVAPQEISGDSNMVRVDGVSSVYRLPIVTVSFSFCN